MNLAAKIAYNSIIQIISKFTAAALGLVAIGMIMRYLEQFGFGQYSTVITFLSFFGILADLGLTLITAQMISQPGANEDKILSNLFTLRLISAFFFLGLAPLTIIFFPYQPIIKLGVIVGALSFFFTALNQILVGLFQKHLRMEKVSIAEIGSRVILLAGVYIAIRFDYGLIGILVATVLANAISFIIHFAFSIKFAKIKLAFDWPLWKEIMHKSWPLALTITFNTIYLKADILILSLIKSQTAVGIYSAAYKVIDVLIIVPFMFAGLILPIITAAWAQKNYAGFANVIQKSFNVMAILALPLMVGAQFLAKPIITLVGGENFSAAGDILKVLIGAAGIIFLGSVFTHAIIAIDKQKNIIAAYAFTSVTALIGYLIFIPRFSYYGAAWVTIYSELTVVIASLYLIWKYTKILPKMNVFFKSAAASAIMGLALYFSTETQYLNLFINIALGSAIYFISLYFLKGIDRQQIKEALGY